MGARAIWKGTLQVGAAGVPVKLYSAVEDRDVHFHILQNQTRSRVKQHMVAPESEAEIAPAEIRKGYEVESGTFVLLKEDELDRLKAKESHEIKATRFVAPAEINPEWYERPYYLAPDASEANYFALAAALRKANAYGIVRWTMRGRRHIGAIAVEGPYLVLFKLRYAEEVLPANELPSPGGRALDPKELRMAEELISALAGDFEPEEFRDTYRDRLSKFIEAKAKGKRPRLGTVKTRPASTSLTAQLAKSLAAATRGKGKKVA